MEVSLEEDMADDVRTRGGHMVLRAPRPSSKSFLDFGSIFFSLRGGLSVCHLLVDLVESKSESQLRVSTLVRVRDREIGVQSSSSRTEFQYYHRV